MCVCARVIFEKNGGTSHPVEPHGHPECFVAQATSVSSKRRRFTGPQRSSRPSRCCSCRRLAKWPPIWIITCEHWMPVFSRDRMWMKMRRWIIYCF